MTNSIEPPFPYTGGKRAIADVVWARFGSDIDTYIEPFLGAGAVLLASPHWRRVHEIVNDADGLVVNFWRAVQYAPDAVAAHAAHPVYECDFHARRWRLHLAADGLRARLEGDPEYYDARLAGWWAWCVSLCIGGSDVVAPGPWSVLHGQMAPHGERGIRRQIPHLGRGRNLITTHVTAPDVIRQRLRALAHRLRGVRITRSQSPHAMKLELQPITCAEACAFITQHHRGIAPRYGHSPEHSMRE